MANILIADNYLSIGLLYREILEQDGHKVLVAKSGKAALLTPRIKSRIYFAGMTVGTHHLIPAAHQVQDRSRHESTGLR